MKTDRTFWVVLILCLSALLVICGCGHEKGERLPNASPHVKVSGGPPNLGTATYTVPIYWFGWDEDGVVDHFVYAIDDTTGPESWIETRFFQGSFLFSAESIRTVEEFGRWHTFYVKAIDNEGAVSYPDFLTFDARTVAPKTTILSPRCDPEGSFLCQGALNVGLSVKVVWEGEDPDSRDPRKRPVAYQWRLFNTSLITPFGVEDAGLLDTTRVPCGQIDTTSCWSQPTSQTEITFPELQEDQFWLFGVRAVDEAGATEPGLRMNYNVIFFKTMEGSGIPTLTLYEGASVFESIQGDLWTRQVPAGKQITFGWEGDASSYGGTISGYRYGIDIEDLNDPTQWSSAWSAEVRSASVQFDKPGVHYFYVEVKDYADVKRLVTVEIEVIDFLFDREILFVDDFFDAIPTDAVHDAFAKAMLSRYTAYADTLYIHNCWDVSFSGTAPEILRVIEPPLSLLTRYKLIIWDSNASINTFATALRAVAVLRGTLGIYLRGGGNLWLYGIEVVRGTAPDALSFAYGTVPVPESFAARFLKLTGVVNRPMVSTAAPADGFRGAIPNRKISDQLPTLMINYATAGTNPAYGLTKVEAVMSAMQEPDLQQRPDTLYFYRANYITSSYMNKACGFRFHDVFSGSKVVYMGFPMHYFYQTPAESLGTFVIDWMYETLAPSGSSRLTFRE